MMVGALLLQSVAVSWTDSIAMRSSRRLPAPAPLPSGSVCKIPVGDNAGVVSPTVTGLMDSGHFTMDFVVAPP